MTQHICKTCGGELVQAYENKWSCKYCGNVFEDETVQRDSETLRSLLDNYKIEMVANLRKNLYEEINAPNISSESICHICERIKEYLPDDFMANFFYVANCENTKKLAREIRNINVDTEREVLDEVIVFLIRSLTPDILLELMMLVERAYKETNLKKYEYYATEISTEAEKVANGIYETSIPRDVFVAYSSANIEVVTDLVSLLEANNISCFVAARNLRHGRGAVENYLDALHQAMDNCKTVVFVSSLASRNMACDALKVELPYIKQKDIESSPFEFRQNYAAMPHKYKKPRVEYRIEQSSRFNVADTIVREFFEGYEYAYSAEEVAQRISKLLIESASATEKKEEVKAPDKYCAKCGTKNSASAKFCLKCRNSEFLESRKEYELLMQVKAANADKAMADEERRKNNIYFAAINEMETNDIAAINRAIQKFTSLNGWRDSTQKISECQTKLYNLSRPVYQQPPQQYQNPQYPAQQYPYTPAQPYPYPMPKPDTFPIRKKAAQKKFKTWARINIFLLIAYCALNMYNDFIQFGEFESLLGEWVGNVIAIFLLASFIIHLPIRWSYNCRSKFWGGFHRFFSYLTNGFGIAAAFGMSTSGNDILSLLCAGLLFLVFLFNIIATKSVGKAMKKIN